MLEIVLVNYVDSMTGRLSTRTLLAEGNLNPEIIPWGQKPTCPFLICSSVLTAVSKFLVADSIC